MTSVRRTSKLNRSSQAEPSGPNQAAQPRPRERGVGQFGLASLMAMMTVLTVSAAIFGKLMQQGSPAQLLVLGLMAPMGLMVLLAGWRTLRRWWYQRQRQ